MDARLQFEWNGEKARDCVAKILGDNNLVPDQTYGEMIDRDDADYEVKLSVMLKHKRKTRKDKKSDEQKRLDI